MQQQGITKVTESTGLLSEALCRHMLFWQQEHGVTAQHRMNSL